jgi:hypothetical protein
MRRCWSIAEVVVFGVIAFCVLIPGCDEHRETVHHMDDRPRREVIVEHDRRPREREVEVRREGPRHEEHRDHD